MSSKIAHNQSERPGMVSRVEVSELSGALVFYPTKNLGGFGDGGMLTSNNDQVADRLRLLANHGMRPRYYHSDVGINSRLDSIQAAMLGIKMKYLDSIMSGRQTNAENYDRLFAQSGLRGILATPECDTRCGHVWNQYTVRVSGQLSRDEVREQLAEKNVGSEIYYPVPLHQQDCFPQAWLSDWRLARNRKKQRLAFLAFRSSRNFGLKSSSTLSIVSAISFCGPISRFVERLSTTMPSTGTVSPRGRNGSIRSIDSGR